MTWTDTQIVDPSRPARRIGTNDAWTAVRRSRGPLADELFVHCRPADGVRNAGGQAEALYEALLDTLASEGVGADTLVTETVFFRAIDDDAEAVRVGRARALGFAGLQACRPATTFIQQPPLDAGSRIELMATALIPRYTGSSSYEVTSRGSACPTHASTSGASPSSRWRT